MPAAPVLSPAEIEHFETCGMVKVEQAVDPALIGRWVERMWARLGYDPADPRTWTEGKIHMPNHEHAPVAEVAPRAHAAIAPHSSSAGRSWPGLRYSAFTPNASLPTKSGARSSLLNVATAIPCSRNCSTGNPRRARFAAGAAPPAG